MPITQTASVPAKQVIDATIPGSPNSPVKNISDADRKRILGAWDRQAAERTASVARECLPSSKPTRVIRFELQQFGRYWQACVIEMDMKKNKVNMVPLLGAPSLLASALDALEDAMLQRANRA